HKAPVASVPEGANATITTIEVVRIPAVQAVHRLRQGVLGARCDEEVDVVVHQHESVNLDAARCSRALDQLEIATTVMVIAEDRHPVVATLDDMNTQTRLVVATQSRHPRGRSARAVLRETIGKRRGGG